MGWTMQRFIEKITGTPHRHDIAESVHTAAAGVSRSVDKLSAALKPYSQSDEPLVALMTEVFNRLQLKSKPR
jgi:hypothetical protein